MEHLKWSRKQVHRVLDAELARLGGDASRVALGGTSQGCCMAIDAALTYQKKLAGVFASFGQLYSCTPIPQAWPRSTRGSRSVAAGGTTFATTFAAIFAATHTRPTRFHARRILPPSCTHAESHVTGRIPRDQDPT